MFHKYGPGRTSGGEVFLYQKVVENRPKLKLFCQGVVVFAIQVVYVLGRKHFPVGKILLE